MATRRVLMLDLKDDPERIARYRAWHAPGGPPAEVIAAIRRAGVEAMEIFLAGNRLVMLMTVGDSFDARAKAAADAADPATAAWEALMWEFQQPLPFAGPGEKWVEAAQIFRLADH